MAGQSALPPHIAAWIDERQDEIARALRASRYAVRQGDARRETLDALGHLAVIERAAREAVHLLTVYAARESIATPTQVAAATGTTVSTASTRAGSRLAQRLWDDVTGHAGADQRGTEGTARI